MKAVRVYASGKEKRLQLEEVQPPKLLGDQEVLVRIRDAGVNAFDFSADSVPRTAGRDFAGQVMETGEAVKGFAIGDRVFGFAEGSYAEFAVIPAGMLARMPKSTDFDAAAALPTPALTAYQIVLHDVMAEQGDLICVRGAASVTGEFVVQLAEWRGAEVVADVPPDREATLVDLTRDYALRPNGAQLGIVAKLVDAGVLRPRLGRVLPLADAGLALELLHSQGGRGKIVLSVSHP
ncbi:MAG TPA: zinc-binding dehydrogenase [Burkholderiales bacterium]|nr:zinc-binding dehydrogenase [Burkholderiales bacterium]